ncbi:hypothetical protein LG651_05505 [Tamlana sp. 62-3]|uniref:Glycine dehydrogenase n=1 Tax=Neotamlana sargassicola TaxID=2883125 RepID=A0A9X1I580_9FLAO|nr:hypothetical protein [Tamlana sargassicola]MCB4807698.1 hypothetical protein [Tamlana sargassicola]
MKKSVFFISCDEAKHICDKAQYDEASSWEKFKLSVRLMYCNVTQKYYKRNKKLTKVVKSSNAECLNPKEREALEMKFKKELSKH